MAAGNLATVPIFTQSKKVSMRNSIAHLIILSPWPAGAGSSQLLFDWLTVRLAGFDLFCTPRAPLEKHVNIEMGGQGGQGVQPSRSIRQCADGVTQSVNAYNVVLSSARQSGPVQSSVHPAPPPDVQWTYSELFNIG